MTVQLYRAEQHASRASAEVLHLRDSRVVKPRMRRRILEKQQ